MPAPVLTAVCPADLADAEALGAAPELFVVVVAGSFRGASYDAGDVLVCDGVARHGDPVVLVARGHGRPRLGEVRGKQLIGDAGERCLEARWRAAGPVVSVLRGAVEVRTTGRRLGEVPRALPRGGSWRALGRAAARQVEQLSLFGAAA